MRNGGYVNRAGGRYFFIEHDALDRYCSDIVFDGLGETLHEKEVFCIAAVLDLKGFTNFCSEADASAFVPKYIMSFLDWFFEALRNVAVREKLPNGVTLWFPLPNFVKFLGDGLLVIWRIPSDVNRDETMGNVVVGLHQLCSTEWQKFNSKLGKSYPQSPERLRCGVARGTLFPLRGGKDFVGSCINRAARLQKLGLLSFSVWGAGLDDLEKVFSRKYRQLFTYQTLELRGYSGGHPILVIREEWDCMSPEQRSQILPRAIGT